MTGLASIVIQIEPIETSLTFGLIADITRIASSGTRNTSPSFEYMALFTTSALSLVASRTGLWTTHASIYTKRVSFYHFP